MSDITSLPRHVAVIMDGNGRWARQHAVSVAMGHRQGVETLREIIRYSSDIGIKVLSLYAFSTENWQRCLEVKALMQLIVEFLARRLMSCTPIGCASASWGTRTVCQRRPGTLCYRKSAPDNSGLMLNIAINYGARMNCSGQQKRWSGWGEGEADL